MKIKFDWSGSVFVVVCALALYVGLNFLNNLSVASPVRMAEAVRAVDQGEQQPLAKFSWTKRDQSYERIVYDVALAAGVTDNKQLERYPVCLVAQIVDKNLCDVVETTSVAGRWLAGEPVALCDLQAWLHDEQEVVMPTQCKLLGINKNQLHRMTEATVVWKNSVLAGAIGVPSLYNQPRQKRMNLLP